MSSKNRKFRAKTSSQDDEGEDGHAVAPPPPPPPAKEKPAKPRKTALLSFEDGEEEYNPIGQSKKPSKAKGSKFRREKGQEEPAAVGPATQKPAAGMLDNLEMPETPMYLSMSNAQLSRNRCMHQNMHL
jgi:hypothetical protein